MYSITIFVFCYLLPSLSLAHNWLLDPPPYNLVFRTDNCRGSECTSACPLPVDNMPNSADNPSRVYRRGQRVFVKWARNNHHGGMFRISLVPVEHMWDRDWHKKLTLLHGCWESGAFKCANGEDCGTDKNKDAFGRWVDIPSVFDDGIYVMGYVWYGGLRWQRDFGQFSDFYSCSFVRIRGGDPLGGRYTPFFEAGEGDKIENGKCLTSASSINDCRTGCNGKRAFWAIPKVFEMGGMDDITVGTVKGNMTPGGGADERKEPVEAKSGMEEEEMPKEEEPPMMSEEEIEEEEAEEEEEEEVSGMDKGICVASVCCSSSCGKCGGSGCNKRDGGGAGCCTSVIKRSGRVCGGNTYAPCIVRD